MKTLIIVFGCLSWINGQPLNVPAQNSLNGEEHFDYVDQPDISFGENNENNDITGPDVVQADTSSFFHHHHHPSASKAVADPNVNSGVVQADTSSITRHHPSAYKVLADQNENAEDVKSSFDYRITDDGNLYIDGQIINLFPSTNDAKYPASDGWMMCVFKGITFYFLKDGGKIVLVPVKQKFTTLRVDEQGIHEVFSLAADGTVFSSDGKALTLTPSKYKDHPASAGWMTMKHNGNTFFQNVIDGHPCAFG